MGYKTVKYGKKAERRNYSKMLYDIDLPNLIEIQTESFDKFVNEDIAKLLHDFSPIEAPNGEVRLYFGDPYLEKPKFSLQESKYRDISYTRQLYSKVRLEHVLNGNIYEDTILMTEIPYMTPTGTFIINGAERVIVSQIVRSSGIYYTGDLDKKTNKIKYSAQIIPTRGAWIEYEMGSKNLIYGKLDRSKKIYLTTLIRALGFNKNKEITDLFDKSLLSDTLMKDDTQTSDEAVVELYSKLRQGEIVSPNAAREYIRLRLFDPNRYDLAEVGRYKYNQKLDLFNRARGYLTTTEIKLLDGEIIPAKTEITADIIKKLQNSRELFRKEVISKENSLQNEPEDEIYVIKNPEDGRELLAKNHILDVRTGEVIVKKNTVITPEVLKELRRKKFSLDENVINYFLKGDVFLKEQYREGVIVEMIDVVKKDSDTGKESIVRIIGNDQREDRLYVTVSDILASISYYLNLYIGIGSTDDIDHLGNRRLRTIGELLKNQFRIGLARTEKNIKDKMSTVSFTDVRPANLINMSPLTGVIKSFFGSSQLSQFMDQINPLAELTQKRRISALGTGGLSRDRAGIEVRDVHNSHYGRICPIETPEGQSIGLISSLASYSRVDKYGFIQTPYLVVDRSGIKNGNINPIVTSEYKYLTADEEALEVIASAATPVNEDGSFISNRIIGRLNGETGVFDKSEVSYMDVSPKQIVSVATSTIPFLEHDDASRALMGANMQRQAVPLLMPHSPIVGTGIEYRAAKDSGANVVSYDTGFVTYVDANQIEITKLPTQKIMIGNEVVYEPGQEFTFEAALKLAGHTPDATATYKLIKFNRSNQDTCIIQKPIVVLGEWIDAGDVIADGPSTDKGELALGRNVTVAFTTWEGYNYEDAVIMCEDLVINDVYTSVHIDEYEVYTKDLKVKNAGKEMITREIPHVKPDTIRFLDEKGVIVPGSEVKEGDVLVGKITPKGSVEPSPAEKLILSIVGEKSRDQRDSSLKVPHGSGGTVQKIEYFSKKNGDILLPGVNEMIKVYVAKKRKITEGDKMAGRHGNKGVISKILPREDMPYTEDGTPIDIILNPQGVPSRMNIGQILEIHAGDAAQKLGIKIATPVFDGVEDKDLRNIIKEANASEDGKIVLYDGRTGEPFSQKISVGVMYMIKLSHMVDDKLHARADGPYTLVTQQPMGGKAQNGGQRFGEMEVWALYAYGAAHTLQEMLTVKSDDMIGRNRVYNSITNGYPMPKPGLPESFRVLTHELQALGLYVELINSDTGDNDAVKSLVDNKPGNMRGGFR